MTIDTISQSEINVSKKYKPLIKALHKLEKGGQAIQVSFEDESEFESLEDIVSQFNRKNEGAIKSNKHSRKNEVFFYK